MTEAEVKAGETIMIPDSLSMPDCAADKEARAQSETYGFLAEVFNSHPTERNVRALGAMAAELGIACPSDFSLSELDREYMDLFVIPGPRYVAPYESVFRDEWPLPAVLRRGSNPSESGSTIKGLLMGESTMRVRGWYLRAGLLPENDLPDHIANEFRFLAWICARRAVAGADEAQALAETEEKFRREHIRQWIGELRERVAQRDRLGFYHAALRVAECLVREDTDQFNELPESSLYPARSAEIGGDQREPEAAAECGRFSKQVSACLGGVRRTGCPMS